FMLPVDVAFAPGYLDLVKHPMDLSTAARKVAAGQYATVADFLADIHQIWANCLTYNQPGTPVYRQGQKMQQ
ncbi:hypothetical protein CXG81DRAFT_2271, partial [Caulochytrium protostelioides]